MQMDHFITMIHNVVLINYLLVIRVLLINKNIKRYGVRSYIKRARCVCLLYMPNIDVVLFYRAYVLTYTNILAQP